MYAGLVLGYVTHVLRKSHFSLSTSRDRSLETVCNVRIQFGILAHIATAVRSERFKLNTGVIKVDSGVFRDKGKRSLLSVCREVLG